MSKLLRRRVTRRRFIGTSAAAAASLAAFGCAAPSPTAPGQSNAPGAASADRSAAWELESLVTFEYSYTSRR